MMLVQAFGAGTVGTAVAAGVSYTVAFRAVAGAVGLVLVVLFGLYAAGRLPVGGEAHRTAA
jgi:hypothetical protein